MSKTRKILGFVMAIALVLNIFAIAVFAADDNGSTLYNASWSLSSTKFGETVYENGETVVVDVILNTDYVVGPIEFALDYDAASFDYVSAALGAGYKYAGGATVTASPNAEGNKLKVLVIPNTSGLTTLPAQQFNDGAGNGVVIASITFTFKGTTGTIAIDNDPKSGANGETGYLCAYRLANGNDIITATGADDYAWNQHYTVEAAKTVTGAAAVVAVFQKKATAAAGIVIDTNKTMGSTYTGTVYGFTQTAVSTFASTAYLNNSFEVTEGGSLTYTRGLLGNTGGYGTGTVITAKDAGGTVIGTYVVVIFGDLDGNGLINGTDATKLLAAVKPGAANTLYPATPAGRTGRMACNCFTTNVTNANHHNLVNGNDLTILLPNIKPNVYLNQAATATSHYNYSHAIYGNV